MTKKKRHLKIYIKKQRIFFAGKILGGFFLFSLFFSIFLFFYYTKDLPRPEDFTEKSFILPTQIYDRNGQTLLYQIYGEEKRVMVSSGQISDYLKQAVITAEDANFYRHFGLDIKSIFRSILKNLQIGQPLYGGSTISQQLIRSSFLSREKTLQRKIKEVVLTLELERRYPKEKILELYLNQIPFGNNAYGAQAASQTYFQKSASALSLEESALLAALIKSPSYFSYGENEGELLARKDYILDRMAELGYINGQEAQNAKNKQLKFSEASQTIKAPHFVLYVKKYLEEKYPDYFLKEKGLKVYTTLDWTLQTAAEEIVKTGVNSNLAYNSHNAGLVAINPQTGEIVAMVGSADYFAQSYPKGCAPGLNCLFEPRVNVAVYGQGRQPGSAFKPFAYAQALQKGLTPETMIWDVKTEFNPDCDPSGAQEKDQYGMDCYHPQNYDEKFRGAITARQALAQSINVPSIKVLYLAGLKETIDLAKSFGITTLNKPLSFYGLSLVLGGGEVKLLDLVSAYGVLATGGTRVVPTAILKIEDAQGNIIEENKKTQKRVLETKVADIINSILSDNEARAPIFGSRSLLNIPGYQVAVKTGTSQEFKDGWTIGYTSSLVVGVWVGNNNGALMNKEPGVVLAGPIWNRFMQKALPLYSGEEFTPIETAEPSQELEPHSLLYYFREKPDLDPQFQNWEWAIQNWLENR